MMSVFDKLVKELLDDLQDDVAKKLLGELKDAGKDHLSDLVTKQVSRIIVKGIDEVVEASVKVLDEEKLDLFVRGYLEELDNEWVEVYTALREYIPLQVNVEVAKRRFGKNSAEANAAREVRAEGIKRVRAEISDVIDFD